MAPNHKAANEGAGRRRKRLSHLLLRLPVTCMPRAKAFRHTPLLTVQKIRTFVREASAHVTELVKSHGRDLSGVAVVGHSAAWPPGGLLPGMNFN